MGYWRGKLYIEFFLPSYIRGGLADGVLCGKGGRCLSRGSAGAGSAGHIPGISLALDVGVVQRHGGGGVTVVNYVLNYLIKFCLRSVYCLNSTY